MRNIVVLTGAGISAESGIKTFRASDGLWEEHPIEDVAVPEAFERNSALVHEFYKWKNIMEKGMIDIFVYLNYRILSIH